MKKLVLSAIVLLFALGVVLAEGEKKSFIKVVKGNFWKYDVVERGKKKEGKIEVIEIDKDGKIKVKLTGMEGPSDDMTWKMSKDYLIWEVEMGMEWKVLKFGAQKNDTWNSEFKPQVPGGPGMDPEMKMVLKSKVVEVEDLDTKAGKIKGCLKVETRTEGGFGGNEIIAMWWAQGVGLVKVQVKRGEEVRDSWILTSYKVGPDISDQKLKGIVEKADVVAMVTIPKEGANARKVQVRLNGLYKGEPKTKEGEIFISQPPAQDQKLDAFKPGEFVVFLKKEGEALILIDSAIKAEKDLLDRITKLLTPPDKSPDKLKGLCDKAAIIVAVEIVVLEERGSFKYYVAKVLSAAKGAKGREYLDVLSLPGMELEKGKKYILLLVETEKSGRKMTQLVDVAKGVLDYDEGMLKKLSEIVKGSK